MIVPPIAAIYVIDAFTLFRNTDAAASIRDLPPIRWEAIGVWLGSVAIILTVPGDRFTLTTVPALDATIVAAVGYAIVLKARKFWTARSNPAIEDRQAF